MKHLNLTILFILLIFPYLLKAQNESLKKDSVYLDSVEVVHEKLLQKIHKFYYKNIEDLDSSNYLVAIVISSGDSSKKSLTLDIDFGKDIGNDIQFMQTGRSCYFMIDNTLVLIPWVKESDYIFKKTNKKRKIDFSKKEYVYRTAGISATSVGYRIFTVNNSAVRIKKLYSYKYPYTRLQWWYYKLRHGIFRRG